MNKGIRFRIGRDSVVHLEVEGVTGPSCDTISKPFVEALGLEESSQRKPEWVESLDGLTINVEES